MYNYNFFIPSAVLILSDPLLGGALVGGMVVIRLLLWCGVFFVFEEEATIADIWLVVARKLPCGNSKKNRSAENL